MSVLFSHPYGVGALVLRLRDPEFGDDETINTFTRFKIAMDGSDYSYRSTPFTTALNLQFANLTRRKAEEVRNFIRVSAGDEIGFVDHMGQSWRGKLLIEAAEIITDGKGPGDVTMRKEGNSITLQFEGVKLP